MLEASRLSLTCVALWSSLAACSGGEPVPQTRVIPAREDTGNAARPSTDVAPDAGDPTPAHDAAADSAVDVPLCALSLNGAVTMASSDCAQVTLVQEGARSTFKLATDTFGASLVVEFDGAPTAGSTFVLADARTGGEGLVRSGRARWRLEDRGASGDGDFALTIDSAKANASGDAGRGTFSIHGSLRATFAPLERTGAAGNVVLEGTF